MKSEGSVLTDDGVHLYFLQLGNSGDLVLVPNGLTMADDFALLARGRTLVFYDVRNRGLSDTITDPAKLARGIHQDVDDLDAVRRHFGADRVALIGHSYMGMTVALYAIKYPEHTARVVQIGAVQPDAAKKYPPELSNQDGVLQETFGKLAALEKERAGTPPVEFCKKFWSVLRAIYVADQKYADRIESWGRCELSNERGFMSYWMQHVMPSIQKTALSAEDFQKASAPVFGIHGRKDRSAPYGGGREWTTLLPNARLLTVDHAAHAPWIEAPDLVFPAMETFLAGGWPAL